jgi:arylsulfatase A-like enzyme
LGGQADENAMTGIPAPVMVDGIAQKPIEGVSMAYTFDKANADAPSRHHTQYFEMFGVQGLYNDGWMPQRCSGASTVGCVRKGHP